MPTLEPVDHDPFEGAPPSGPPRIEPVEHDPFVPMGQDGYPAVNTPTGEMRSYEPSLSERFKGLVSDALSGLGAKAPVAEHLAGGITSLAGFTPVGVAFAGSDLQRAVEAHDPVSALTAALGVIPAARPEAIAARELIQSARAAAREAPAAAAPAKRLAPVSDIYRPGADPMAGITDEALTEAPPTRRQAPAVTSDLVKRGEEIKPPPPPTEEALAAARADTRVGNDIVNKRLDTIVPESERVAGGTYTPGAPGGGRWSDLPDKLLNQHGAGFNVSDQELGKLWDQSVAESSQAAKNAVDTTGAKPTFSGADWNSAMRLPIRDHLWYELSGERLAENLPDLTSSQYMKLMDLIGATSARADPKENLERALGVMSQYMRGRPVDVDLTIPSTVRMALARDSHETSALPGNKTGHFSDTPALTGGVPTRFPISVNDVWVGKMFGIDDSVMSSNQSLHEPMAKYFNKIRDLYNERHGDELPFKYQSWNFQAPSWVYSRGGEGAASGDAYHQVWGDVIDKLKAGGVKGIEGDVITKQALMDPKFADVMRRTTGPWREAPKATVEFGTTQTNTGKTAHDLYKQAIDSGDQLSQHEYLKGLTTAMYESARGAHPWEALKKAVTGDLTQRSNITRIASPTSDLPLDIGGTFEGAVSPNIRVPLAGMTDDQIRLFNAVAGRHLKQDAMAVSQIRPVEEGTAPAEGYIRGYSAFVPTTEQIQPGDIRAFAKELSKNGHDMSYARYPNGYMFDVLPAFTDAGPKGVDRQVLEDAYEKTLSWEHPKPEIGAHDFKSVYTPRDEYSAARRELLKGMQDDFIRQAEAAGTAKGAARQAIRAAALPNDVTGATKRAWATYQGRLGHLADAEAKFQGLADRVATSHSDFIDRATARIEKQRRAAAAYEKRGGKLEPVEHNPFAAPF